MTSKFKLRVLFTTSTRLNIVSGVGLKERGEGLFKNYSFKGGLNRAFTVFLYAILMKSKAKQVTNCLRPTIGNAYPRGSHNHYCMLGYITHKQRERVV